MIAEESIEKIRRRFGEVELSVSSYDTAWVAMVPSNNNSLHQHPRFPSCLEWIKENQLPDGSWGLNPSHPSLVLDSISSTLACVLAMRKWNVGEQLVQKGLEFIESKKYILSNKHDQLSPLGFDIIFSGMMGYANDFGLTLPLDSAFVDLVMANREIQLRSFAGKEDSSLAYFTEGLGESHEWEKTIKKVQRSNGSLFNSPATTAASSIHHYDENCFRYLNSLITVHSKAVPTVYPFDIYARLCIVDAIDRMGINRHFEDEIKEVLDRTYRHWELKDEEIFLDTSCCVLAFRLLRMNGYNVSSDLLGDLVDPDHFFKTISPQFTKTDTVIQLYKASQIPIFQNEPILDKIQDWTSKFLNTQLLNKHTFEETELHKEVEYALGYPIDTLDRLAHRKGIELYNKDKIRMLKTSYRCANIDNNDILTFAQEDFNKCQVIHHAELLELEKWVKESEVGGLDFKWHILVSSYFLLAAIHFAPELKEARMAWTKNSFTGTIIDDMFDIDGSTEELLNITELIEKWDGESNIPVINYCSERARILSLALVEIINEQAAKGSTVQGRCIKHELIEIWRAFMKCGYKEMEWAISKYTPLLNEYTTNGVITTGIGLYSVNLYFLGPSLSPDVLESDEYIALFKHAGIIGRYFNDYQGALERDKVQRKLNACFLLVTESKGAITVEEARNEVRKIIESSRREELRAMFARKPTSVIPKEFVESFFKLNKMCYYLYNKNDEYRNPGITYDHINDLIYNPLEPISDIPEHI